MCGAAGIYYLSLHQMSSETFPGSVGGEEENE